MIHIETSRAPADRLNEFVNKMRAAQPFGVVDWSSDCWDLTGCLTRAGKRLHIRTRDALWFVQHRKSRSQTPKPFSSPFADFAKAVVAARHVRGSQTVSAHRVSLRAARYLYAALAADASADPRRLEHRHFVIAENSARAREKVSSAYRVGQRLEEIAAFVDQWGIAHVRLHYTSSIPKSDVAPIATKMPSTGLLEALADISASKALYDDEASLICMRVVDILVATGFRIGEVLTLPARPIVRKGSEIGLLYWPEKGGKSRVKSISSVHCELVERAVRDLTGSCREARNAALWHERNPGRIRWPKDPGETISARDIEDLGLSLDGAAWFRAHKVATALAGRAAAARRIDVEHAIRRMQLDRPILTAGNGKTQTLGESLIVVFRNQLHAERSTNKFVTAPLSHGAVSDFLGGRHGLGKASVFSRFGSSDEALLRITSHQFRHWLSTIAKRGGLSEVELARWMGRRRIADNRAYDHRTQDERAEEARALIRAGKADGAIAAAYRSLPSADAETFLLAQVNAVLTTPYGMCVHDYGQGPCERHFSCAGCSELLRRKGDADERAALTSMLRRTRETLRNCAAEEDDGTYGASNWLARQQRLEIDLIAMLAVDDSASDDGDLVRVWPRGAKRSNGNDS